jgi:hypothetical protein
MVKKINAVEPIDATIIACSALSDQKTINITAAAMELWKI